MSLLTRNRTVLAKSESVYGTDPTPTGSANAMLVKNLNVSPLQAEKVSRDLIRPYFGNSEQLLATNFVTMDFEVEAVGSGVIGKAPAYDCLLRACALAKQIQTASISIVVASLVATVTHTAHGFETGDKVIIDGANESDLNGEQTITVTNANTYTFSTTESDGSATGTIVAQTGVKYLPITSGLESVTLYYNVSGVLHKVTGARGTVELSFSVKQIPVFKFSFTGLYNAPSDTAAPTVDFTSFKIPEIANTQNTPGFSLHGYSANLESVNFNLANEVSYVSLIGAEEVKIIDRKPAGTLVFEAPTIAEKDFFSIAADTELGALQLQHGSRNGYKVQIDAPSVGLENPSYQDSNGVQMLSVPYTANPESGNDELEILFN